MPDIPLPKPQPPKASTTLTPSLPSAPGLGAPAPAFGGAIKTPTPNSDLLKPTSAPIPSASSLPKPPISTQPSSSPTPLPSLPSLPNSNSVISPAKLPAATPLGAPPSKTPPPSNSPQPEVAKLPGMTIAGKPIKKFLPFIIGGIVLLLVAIGAFAFFNSSSKSKTNASTPTTSPGTAGSRQTVPSQKTTLNYWGLWESNATLDAVFRDFETKNPGVEIVYKKQSHVDYRQRLQSAIASGNGPDIFRYHASWTPMLSAELSPLPGKIMSAAEYQKTFYPVATQQLQLGGQLVGIPLMYDGLALFYNKDVLSTSGDVPPKTWTELKTLATKLTIRSSEGIKRSGLAIGNASTTEHFSDIIALLMFQNGADPADLTTKEAQEALTFYTNFVTKDKIWNEKLPSSTVAFARGDAAMMMAPSWRAHEVMAINPELSFGIVSTPDLGEKKVALASYWAEGVNSKSKNSDISWQLLKYLSSAEVMTKLYSSQSQTRSFGEIYSRVDLANSLASDPLVAPFLADAPYAKGWYLSSYTHDNGINDNLIKYYTDAVNSLLAGKKIDKVMETLSLGSKQILRQYGLSQTSAPAQMTK